MDFIKKYVFAVIVLSVSGNNYSQEIPELVTDRPDRTESASTVPVGWLQVESGYEFVKEKSDDNSDLNSLNIGGALLRYGIAEKFEIRLGGAYLFHEGNEISGTSESSGLFDFMAGAKYEIINGHSSIPDIGFMVHFFLPIGAENIKPVKLEPQALVSVSKSFTDYLGFGINLGAHHSSISDNIFYFYTLAAGIDITDKLGSFIELSSEIFSNSLPFHSAGAGITYLLLPNLQLDLSGGTGLFNNSEVWYFGSGISIRFPR